MRELDPATPLPVEALRVRVTAALGRGRRALAPGGRVPAAVLVLFVYRAGVPALVFGKKTEDVPHHKGQFSFPGGVVRSSDGSAVEAALREAQEEIGLDPSDVEVLGVLDDVPTTVTSFVITPVLGLARSEPSFRPDGREIERVIEIPLAHLLGPSAFREEEWEREGVKRPVVFVSYGEDVVWGTTGRILRELLDALFPEARRMRSAG
ncbi:MAG TPA: CoA pyrophosphatase [Methylomirabilota bacterium]|nr:CoA pyrophosphatase [Methylomirabilota bacterium]